MSNFTVTFQPGTRIIRIDVRGVLTMADVERLSAAQAAQVGAHGFRPGEYSALVNVAGAAIQTGEVAEALSNLSRRADFAPARLAFVHGNASSKMQVRRLNAANPARFFDTDDEAMSWLKAGANDLPGAPMPQRAVRAAAGR